MSSMSCKQAGRLPNRLVRSGGGSKVCAPFPGSPGLGKCMQMHNPAMTRWQRNQHSGSDEAAHAGTHRDGLSMAHNARQRPQTRRVDEAQALPRLEGVVRPCLVSRAS
jgi:hypothetical protein